MPHSEWVLPPGFVGFSSSLALLLAMSQLRSLVCLLVVLSEGVSASIGPSAVLPIVNKKIAPDGFLRQ